MRIPVSILGAVFAAVLVPGAASAVEEGTKFGDWTVNCEGTGEAQLCHIDQSIGREGTKESALQVGIAYPRAGEPPQILIMAPLGVLLPPGLTVQVDDSDAARVPYTQCLPRGCQTLLNMEADTVTRIKAGKTMKVSYALPNGQKVTVPVSLSGVTAGLEALTPQ